MGYKRSKHYNAVMKMVKEKGMILQKDAQEVMNGSIQTACKQLTDEGKIKRTKVKARYKNGNLNDVWLLYLPNTDYNKVLEYEKELINKPFESPLKEHHCYKKRDSEVLVITESTGNRSNVIDMSEYVRINDYELSIKEYRNQRVVTARDIAELHGKPIKKVNEVFKNNEKHFILNEDYFIIGKNSKVLSTDLENHFTSNRQKEIYLFTETGYLMLTKTFKDDLSWDVHRQLVNTYFKMKQLAHKNETQPINRNEIQSLDIMELMIKEMKNEKQRVDNIESKLNQIVDILAK